MSDNVIIMPIVRVARDDERQVTTIAISLDWTTMARLRRQAEAWGTSEAEAAAGMIERALKPERRK